MDIELFQWVLLGLLALGVVVLVALLATLGGIRKALEQRPGAAASPTGHGEATQDEPAAYQTSAGETPASGYGTYPPSDEPAQATPAPTGRADTIRSVLEQHGLSGSEAESAGAQDATSQQPSSQQGAAAADTGVVDSVFAAHADDPQEEPFQRDGRWWFRRGDELLLYDEPSGQWQPAPDGSLGGQPGATGQAAATAPTGTAAADAGVQTTPVATTPAVADQVATFWKCPTCGAVNGSTAATCRMCFAARP